MAGTGFSFHYTTSASSSSPFYFSSSAASAASPLFPGPPNPSSTSPSLFSVFSFTPSTTPFGFATSSSPLFGSFSSGQPQTSCIVGLFSTHMTGFGSSSVASSNSSSFGSFPTQSSLSSSPPCDTFPSLFGSSPISPPTAPSLFGSSSVAPSSASLATLSVASSASATSHDSVPAAATSTTSTSVYDNSDKQVECNEKEFPGVGLSNTVADVQDVESSITVPGTVLEGVESSDSAAVPAKDLKTQPDVMMKSGIAGFGQKPTSGCVEETQEDASKSSVISSEVGVSDSDVKGHAFNVFSSFAPMTDLTLAPQEAESIIQSILGKHGDITKGSIVKSMVVRSVLLHLVAEVVHRLRKHTIKTLGSDELQLLQRWTEDAAAVGFSLEWLQQRLAKISAASKYHECLVQLDKLDNFNQQVDAIKKSLKELELSSELDQMFWKNEMDKMKIQSEEIDFEGSNLSEGLV